MANLAINGHATRGKEVIEILKMLGGKTSMTLSGDLKSYVYYINLDGVIDYVHRYDFNNDILYSLEEFLEKFPYKVGDKVIAYAEGCLAQFTIQDIRWNDELNKVEYKICSTWCDTSLMQPYKEAPMYLNEKANKQAEEIAKILEPAKEIMEGVYAYNEINCYHQDFGDKVRIRLGGDYEIKEEEGKTYIVKKKPKYPTTYDDCCDVLNIETNRIIEYDECLGYRDITQYDINLLTQLKYYRRLRICRDAYWKIAGEQMGLNKSWEPDWANNNEVKFNIGVSENEIMKCYNEIAQYTLAFPTAEMRDAFFKNFKDLVEQCKDLL